MSFSSTSKQVQSTQRRIALIVQYNGSSFCGWQRQPQGVSVQSSIENAISKLDPYRPIKAIAAGRTDAGVHAAGQVVHFDCSGPIPVNSWASALNGHLPSSIRVLEAVLRPLDWHACYSAVYRRYRYTIYNACTPNLFLSPWTWHRYQFLLDEELMKVGLTQLIGEHDFSAFQKAGSSRNNAYTTIQNVEIDRQGDLIVIEIQAKGFLYGMVRFIVGQLVALGEHRLPLKTFESRWRDRLREEVKESAPAKGLCFLRAGYKEQVFRKTSLNCFPRFSFSNTELPIDPPPINT